MVPVLKASAAVGGLGLATLAYSALWERRWFALRHATLPVLRPAASRPLRLLHLSDLHLLPGQEEAERFVRSCFAQRPDVVVATGDLLGHADAMGPAVDLLSEVRAHRALVVLGSNDFYGPTLKSPTRYFSGPSGVGRAPRLDNRQLLKGLEAGGWTLMDNRRARLDSVAGPLDVAGLGDPHIFRDRPGEVNWSEPPGGEALRLGLVHAPYRRCLDTFERHGFDLVLSGHTHGGQVRLPGFGALVTNCDLPVRQARGLSRVRGSQGPWLHVSAGIGHSKYAPIRFACRPEATLLDLVASPARAPCHPGPRIRVPG